MVVVGGWGGAWRGVRGAGNVLVICPPSHVVCMESLRAHLGPFASKGKRLENVGMSEGGFSSGVEGRDWCGEVVSQH